MPIQHGFLARGVVVPSEAEFMSQQVLFFFFSLLCLHCSLTSLCFQDSLQNLTFFTLPVAPFSPLSFLYHSSLFALARSLFWLSPIFFAQNFLSLLCALSLPVISVPHPLPMTSDIQILTMSCPPVKQYPPVPVSSQRLVFSSALGLLYSPPHKGHWIHPPYFLLALLLRVFVFALSSFLKVSYSPACIKICVHFSSTPFSPLPFWEISQLVT